jgi:hypothetical protein
MYGSVKLLLGAAPELPRHNRRIEKGSGIDAKKIGIRDLIQIQSSCCTIDEVHHETKLHVHSRACTQRSEAQGLQEGSTQYGS